MTYKLAFDKRALKEWEKLGHTIREQFKKKLAERLHDPHIPSARLSGRTNRYKIKLRSSGVSVTIRPSVQQTPVPGK